MSNNPPQLQLSLGHPAFKRSFYQFGLDVDEAEDSEVGASGSSGSGSGASASGSGSGSGSGGSRSVSSGSSYSSQAGESYGYNGGEGNERNKRARSEGPDGTNAVGIVSSPGSVGNSSGASYTTARSGTGDFPNLSQELPEEQGAPQAYTRSDLPNTTAYQQSYETLNGFTLPPFHFGPSTPSVAEFAASRSNALNTRTAEQPPGFEGMLSPRSSSPAPPPVDGLGLDVAMHDEQEEEEDNDEVAVDLEPFRSLASRITAQQNSGSNAFLDTARSDAFLNSATERLRSAMERARTFDRTLAPLRSDSADSMVPSSQAQPRPRLPSFDFESHDRAPSPPSYRDGNISTLSAPPNPFDHQRNRLRTTTTVPSPSPSRRRQSPEQDRLAFSISEALEVETQLGLDIDLHGAHSRNNESSSSSSTLGTRSSIHGSAVNGSRLAALLDDRERALGVLSDRSIDDLTRFISRSENEDNARPRSFFDASELDQRLSGDTINDSNRSHSFSRAQTSPSTSPMASRDLSNNFLPELYGQSVSVRPISHPNPAWERSLNRTQNQTERSAVSADRTQAWSLSQPWLSDNEDLAPGQGSNISSEVRTESHMLSRSQQTQPHPSVFPFSSLLGSRSGLTESEAENNSSRIERMVRLDMGMDVNSHPQLRNRAPPAISHMREDSDSLPRSSSTTSWRLSPLLPSAPPTNLPTLRSALRNVEAWDNLLGEESEEDVNTGAPYTNASTSAVSPSMSGAGLRARAPVPHGEHETTRSTILNSNNARSREHLSQAQAERERRRQNMRGFPNLYTDVPLARTLSDASRADWTRLPRNSDNLTDAGSQQSSNLLAALTSHHRDISRREEEQRSRDEGHRRSYERLTAIFQEEGRARDSELTRLRELRERNRLSLRSRPSPAEHTDRTNPFHRDILDLSRSTDMWSTPSPILSRFTPNSELPPSTEATSAPRTTSHYLTPEGGSGNSNGNGISTSTEAAAYFASGPSHGPPRPLNERPSSSMLRRRRLRLLSSLEESSRPDIRDGLWDDFDLNLEPTDTYGFSGNWRRSPSSTSRPGRVQNSSSDDLLRLLYPDRTAQNDRSPVQQRTDLGSIDAQASRRSSDEFGFNDLPPLEDSRTGTWNFHRLSHRNQDAGATGPTQRGNSRSASRPPSLPPLRFDRLSAMATGRESEGPGSRVLGSEEPSPANVAPWRRSISRLDEFTGWRAPNRGAVERNPDIAMHYALTLQSVRGLDNDRDRSSGAQGAPELSSRPPVRSQGFQHAMDVLGADGLSNSRRQQFSSAFERENDRNRARPPRIETHVRWGELAGDDTDGRPSAHSPHSWAESLRSRRRSPSLFAPPPENADNAPPNRNRGVGTAVGNQNPSSQAAGPPHDWFSMISAGRRPRQRARTARTEDESGSRPFFRIGRNRAGLRNLGDFVRDEDFDSSYENLIALATTLGDVKPRATPAHVLNSLPTGLFKDWQSAGCDARCPICLDDYKDSDPVLKAEPCHHWCHKECLEQWLHTAQTCPVCRTKIRLSQDSATPPPPAAGPSGIHRVSQSAEDITDDISDMSEISDDDFPFLSASPARMNRALFEVLRSNGTLAPSPPP